MVTVFVALAPESEDPPITFNPDPQEDPKSRSLNGGSYKVPLVARVPNYGIYFLDFSGGLGSVP